MPIDATNPTVVSAIYDKWAFSFWTNGFPVADPGVDEVGTVSAVATLIKCRERPDGEWERSPLASDIAEIRVPDIYAEAARRPSVATALASLMAAIQEIGTEQGVI